MKVYLLLSDSDGTMHSSPDPFGYAVKTEEEAKKFLGCKFGYSQGYMIIDVVDTVDDMMEHYKDRQKKEKARREKENMEGNSYYNVLNRGQK